MARADTTIKVNLEVGDKVEKMIAMLNSMHNILSSIMEAARAMQIPLEDMALDIRKMNKLYTEMKG